MRRTLFTIIIALLGVTGAWAKETSHTVNNLIYKVVQPGTGENYAILSGYENYPEGILDIPGIIPVVFIGTKPVKIPVTMIGEQAFIDCEKITQVNIPSTIESIGNLAFNGCISLTSFNVNSKNANFCSENGILFNKAKTTLLQYPSAKADTDYSIPDGVTKIEDWAFYDCNKLTVMTIPSSVATIGEYALNFCTGLTKLFVHATTPPTVGTNAFTNVDLAIPVYVPAASLTAYKAAAGWKDFNNLQALVTEFTVDNLKYKVTDNTANEVELTGYVTKPTGKLDIPASVTYGSKTYSVTSIVEEAFNGCSEITEVTIPASVTDISYNRVFGQCSALTQINVESDNTAYCSEDGVLFNKNKTMLMRYPEGKPETSYIIPEGVTTIIQYAFESCKNLTAVIIPSSMTAIVNNAFFHCSSLNKVIVRATEPPGMGSNVFYAVDKSIPVYVPKESLDAYKAAAGWKEFTNLQALVTEFTVDNLKYKVTDNTANEVELTGYVTKPTGKLDIPASVTYGSKTYSVTSIVEEAFSGCSSLTEVTIPASVTSVGISVFYGCSSLTQATIGDGLTVISQTMFTNCIALEKLFIGKGVTEIKNYAFTSCYNLKEITVLASNPPSVSSDNVFKYVSRDIPVYVPLEALAAYKAAEAWKEFTNLQPISTEFTVDNLKYNVTDLVANTVEIIYGYVKGALNIPATVTYAGTKYKVTSIGVEAFFEADITSLTIPDGITDIKFNAFARCMELTEVNISKSVTNMEGLVFYYCEALRRINVDAANTAYSSENGVLFNKNKTTLLQYPIGRQETTYTVPSSVTTIANLSFSTCTTLKELTLSENVSSIEAYAFENCTAITKMTVLATVPPAVETEPFFGIDKSIPVYVPAASLAAYKTAEVWKEFTNLQAISGAAIDTPSMPESISIQGGTLHNPQQLPVSIYDLTGRPVYSGNATTVELPAGIYVVSCNGASRKAVFRHSI